jgi:hypothetical protein
MATTQSLNQTNSINQPTNQTQLSCTMSQPNAYVPQQLDADGEEGDRGLGKKLLVGAVAGAAAGFGYNKYKKHQRKKHVTCADGKTREIDCDVMVDEHGNEISNQQWDERGRNITAM